MCECKEVQKEMEKKKQRKTDRRTLYTIGAIKDAMLELLAQMSFDRITVANLCRTADITRTTFYLHFANLTEVLDELLADALQVAENDRLKKGDPHTPFITKDGSVELVKEYDALLPMCQRIADLPKYRVLFLDETLSNYIIKTIYRHEKHVILPALMKNNKITKAEAEMIFRFLLNGSFAVNKELGWKKNETWYSFQRTIFSFIRGGLNNIR